MFFQYKFIQSSKNLPNHYKNSNWLALVSMVLILVILGLKIVTINLYSWCYAKKIIERQWCDICRVVILCRSFRARLMLYSFSIGLSPNVIIYRTFGACALHQFIIKELSTASRQTAIVPFCHLFNWCPHIIRRFSTKSSLLSHIYTLSRINTKHQ